MAGVRKIKVGGRKSTPKVRATTAGQSRSGGRVSAKASSPRERGTSSRRDSGAVSRGISK
jgi:hypothetical protein